MKREKTLLKDTLIYMVGNFGSKIISVIMLKFYTSFLSTSEYGTIDIITTTVSLIMPLLSLQLSEAIFRMLAEENDKEKQKKYISSSINIIIINSLILTIITVFLQIFFNILCYEYYIYILIMLIMGCIYELINQIIRGMNLLKLYSFQGILFTLIFTGCNIFFIAKLNKGVYGYLISQIISYFVVSIVGFISAKMYKYYSIEISSKERHELLSYSIPLIPNILSWWILNVSDRYFISYFATNSEVGIYAFSNKIVNLMYVINSIFILAWQSNSIRIYKDDDRDAYYSEVFSVYSSLQSLVVIIFSILSYLLVDIFGSTEYIEAYKYIPLLAVAIMFNTYASYYANNYLILKKTKEIMKTTMIAAIINIIANLIFVPFIGIYGAILSTIIAYMVVWIIRVSDKKISIIISINKKKLLFNFLCVFLASIANLVFKDILLVEALCLAALILFILNNINLVKKLYTLVVVRVFRRNI